MQHTGKRPYEDKASMWPFESHRKSLGETNSAGTLILDFQPPEL